MHDVEVVPDLRAGVADAGRRPEVLLISVWPRLGVGRDRARQILGVRVPTPVVAIIDPLLTHDRMALVEAGAMYLPLPFQPAELLWHLDHLEDRGALRHWLGDVCIDLNSRTVHRSGVPVEMPRKEFDLLNHFVRNQRMVLSREALLDAVWGSQDFHPNAVEVAVSSLRRRLEAHGPRVIHTVRGVGYIARPTADVMDDGLVQLMARRQQMIIDRDALIARRRQIVERATALRVKGNT
jgi:DNA-binding response OmpR family regulator